MIQTFIKRFIFLSLLTTLIIGCSSSEPTTELPNPATNIPLPPPVVNQQNPTETAVVPALPEPTATTTVAEPTTDPVTEPKQAWSADQFGYGIQAHGVAVVGNPKNTMDSIRNQLDLDWVKVQLKWPTIHPEQDAAQWFFYDGVVDEAAAHNLRLMVSVVGAPTWTRAAGNEHGPPDDYQLYYQFLDEMLTRYDGKIDAIEVWNEQNLDREWATAAGISPEDYVSFLAGAYQTIKQHDPSIIVISGALAPTGTTDWIHAADDFLYLDRALEAGMLNHLDCVGAHHNGYNLEPNISFDQTQTSVNAADASFRGPFDNQHHSWSFKTTIDTYAAKVQAIDPSKKLCVTEFGWGSNAGYDGATPTNFGFVNDNTLEEQATYIVQAYQLMEQSGDVWLAFLFNYDFGNKAGGPTDDPVPYSILDLNGIPRPAFGAIAEMEKKR